MGDMDSLYLALMVLTFLVPLVAYFLTCREGSDGKRAREEQTFNFNNLEIERNKRNVPPVLRQNVAITRLLQQSDLSAQLRMGPH